MLTATLVFWSDDNYVRIYDKKYKTQEELLKVITKKMKKWIIESMDSEDGEKTIVNYGNASYCLISK